MTKRKNPDSPILQIEKRKNQDDAPFILSPPEENPFIIGVPKSGGMVGLAKKVGSTALRSVAGSIGGLVANFLVDNATAQITAARPRARTAVGLLAPVFIAVSVAAPAAYLGKPEWGASFFGGAMYPAWALFFSKMIGRPKAFGPYPGYWQDYGDLAINRLVLPYNAALSSDSEESED